jgi:hypothetical protein
MNFNIKETKCPDCGCSEIKSEKREDLQYNGFWNEYRTFACGLKLHFSPNSRKTSQAKYYECSRSREAIEKKQKKTAAVLRLNKYIQRLDVDASFKKSLKDHLRFNSAYK